MLSMEAPWSSEPPCVPDRYCRWEDYAMVQTTTRVNIVLRSPPLACLACKCGISATSLNNVMLSDCFAHSVFDGPGERAQPVYVACALCRGQQHRVEHRRVSGHALPGLTHMPISVAPNAGNGFAVRFPYHNPTQQALEATFPGVKFNKEEKAFMVQGSSTSTHEKL